MQALIESPEYLKASEELKSAMMAWARGDRLDWQNVASQRRRVFELNHRHYYHNIPAYRRLCERENLGEVATFAQITSHLMIADDIFKSYPQQLLDKRDFSGMNAWLREISTFPCEDLGPIDTIDEWITALNAQGLHLVFSSGTSGQMSFVPRDARTWKAFLELPYLYLPQLLGRRGVISRVKTWLVRFLAKVMAPDQFVALIKRFGMRDIDGFFMNFSGGAQGIQLVGQEAGKMTRTAHFLYQTEMSPTAVRAIIRGPRNEREEMIVENFLQATVKDKNANYERIIGELESSTHPVMLFGTPYLVKELCEKVWLKRGRLPLPTGSHVIYGGGWKSFDGARIPESELLALIQNTFGLTHDHVFEGYSMTEVNGLMVKCEANAYHVPPHMEALILANDLTISESSVGTLALLDPFATSYPGFLITGDNVKLDRGRCRCGLEGHTILQVERAPGREVKGCGGIMATINL